jgi:hypothetical protein
MVEALTNVKQADDIQSDEELVFFSQDGGKDRVYAPRMRERKRQMQVIR